MFSQREMAQASLNQTTQDDEQVNELKAENLNLHKAIDSIRSQEALSKQQIAEMSQLLVEY